MHPIFVLNAKSTEEKNFSKNGTVKTYFTKYFPLKTTWLNETRLS